MAYLDEGQLGPWWKKFKTRILIVTLVNLGIGIGALAVALASLGG